MSEFKHISVLARETTDSLNIDPDGIYVDCTAGGGGHDALILSHLSKNGKIIAIDKDPDAIANLKSRFSGDERVMISHSDFSEIVQVVENFGINPGEVSGVLADLGVSSHQLDTASRGFSFHKDAPLDMRLSQSGPSAYDLVNSLSKAEIQDILYKYADEKFAPAIASAIVRAREAKPVETTFELAGIVAAAYPAAARRDGHPARKAFQAIRIAVNDEIGKLENSLESMFGVLKPGGRLAIITFHSLEDRVVKTYFKSLTAGCTCPPDFPVCVCNKKPRGKIPFKPKTPGSEEINENPRSRSAKLRVIEKL